MKKQKVTIEKLCEIMGWHDKGLDNSDVAKITGASVDTVGKYTKIIDQIRKGETYSVNPKTASEKLIDEYCEMSGLDRTKNNYQGEQKQEIEVRYDNEGYEDATTKVEEVREKFYAAIDALINFIMGA